MTLKRLIKSIFSTNSSIELYEQRKSLLNKSGERKTYNIIVCSALAVLAVALLLMSTWVPSDMSTFIESRADLFTVPEASTQWLTTGMVDADCDIHSNCHEQLNIEGLKKRTSLSQLDKMQNISGQPLKLFTELKIDTSVLKSLQKENNFVIAIPRFRYKEAGLYFEGKHLNSYYNNKRIVGTFPSSYLEKETLLIQIVMTILPSDRSIAGLRNNEGILASDQTGLHKYNKYKAARSSNSVGALGKVSKIVLALFCLLLFLIVDSSPESLGLALFMGFEAMAIGIGAGWLPLGWLNLNNDVVIVNFCYQMGDLLKLYFFLQLARIGKPKVAPWLIVGTLVSIPYGFFMEYASGHDMSWVYKIPRTRDTIVGTLGVLFCLRAIYVLRNQTIPWRKAALCIGGAAAFFEVSNSWLAHSDWIRIYPELKTTFAILQANTGYLFALSTFLNISTLENRVQVLTEENSKIIEMKRQMELGQSVQRAFLSLPQLPPDIRLSCHHEAAVYVSGDTYFVHWDEQYQTLTFLLNDVTGHGVQAALKAFASNMIAKTIWVEDDTDLRRGKDRRQQPSRLEKYDQLIDDLLCQHEQETVPDFNAMMGAEFNLESGELNLYRANYNFPMLVSPEFEWDYDKDSINHNWSIKSLAIPNRDLQTFQLTPGTFIIFVSDGFIENARDEASFSQAVLSTLSNATDKVNSDTIRTLALSWASEKPSSAAPDDKTIMVFQWIPLEASKANSPQNEAKVDKSA